MTFYLYNVIQKRGKREGDGMDNIYIYIIYWDFEHQIRTDVCDKIRFDNWKHKGKTIFTVHHWYGEPNLGKATWNDSKQQTAYEVRERRRGYKVKVIPVIFRNLQGGGIEQLHKDINVLLGRKERPMAWNEMQKIVLGRANT